MENLTTLSGLTQMQFLMKPSKVKLVDINGLFFGYLLHSICTHIIKPNAFSLPIYYLFHALAEIYFLHLSNLWQIVFDVIYAQQIPIE